MTARKAGCERTALQRAGCSAGAPEKGEKGFKGEVKRRRTEAKRWKGGLDVMGEEGVNTKEREREDRRGGEEGRMMRVLWK